MPDSFVPQQCVSLYQHVVLQLIVDYLQMVKKKIITRGRRNLRLSGEARISGVGAYDKDAYELLRVFNSDENLSVLLEMAMLNISPTKFRKYLIENENNVDYYRFVTSAFRVSRAASLSDREFVGETNFEF